MNAIELLKKDHETVRGLFAQLKDTPKQSAGQRQQLLEQLAREIKVHSAIEEEIFYPAFKQAAGEGDKEALYFEAVEEHRAVGDLVLPDLLATDPSTDRFSGRAKVLKDLVEHHAQEEEDEMFPAARQLLGSEALEELGRALQERKSELLADPSALEARQPPRGESTMRRSSPPNGASLR